MILLMPKSFKSSNSGSEDEDEIKMPEITEENVELFKRAFIQEASKVASNPPETWKRYPATTQGALAILDMEFKEMLQAKTETEKAHELIHVMAAAMHMYSMCDCNMK